MSFSAVVRKPLPTEVVGVGWVLLRQIIPRKRVG